LGMAEPFRPRHHEPKAVGIHSKRKLKKVWANRGSKATEKVPKKRTPQKGLLRGLTTWVDGERHKQRWGDHTRVLGPFG